MRVSQEISLPGKITSVALSPSGERLAVVVGDRDVHIFRRSDADAAFAPEKIVPLVHHPTNDVENEEEEGETVRLRAAFLDETRLVVQGEMRDTSLTAFCVEIETGERTGEFRAESLFPGVEGPPPIPLSPRHVLVQTLDNVLCLEAQPSLREVFRIRHYDEEGGVIGESDVEDCDEQVAGIAFDPATSLLHVLWGVFNSGSLTGYHLNLDRGECLRVYRHTGVCTDVPAGLCLTPDRPRGLTALTLTLDSIVPLPEGSTTSETPPQYAPLGCLCLREEGDETPQQHIIDVRSALLRDFYWGFHHACEEGREPQVTGIRVSALEPVGTSPFYTAPSRVVVPSPGGFLIEIDTDAGAERERLDLGAPLVGACWHAVSRTIIAGGEEGRLFVVAA